MPMLPMFTVRALPHPEYRRDSIIPDRWVIISTERAGRPIESLPFRLDDQAVWCPFCEGRESETPNEHESLREAGTSSDRPGWRVRVVPNRFPAVRSVDSSGPPSDHHQQPGIGQHEVILECPHHESQLANFSTEQFYDVLWMYRQRMRYHHDMRQFRYAQLFKNVGAAAGASLEHSHAQLIAMPLIPRELQAELDAVATHWNETRKCLYCELIDRERHGPRTIGESSHFIAIAPFASRFCFECWILPLHHESHFDAIDDVTLTIFARDLQRLLQVLSHSLGNADYNLIFHTAPFDDERNHYHWHLEMIPRLTQAAGFEWGTGYAINPVPPEQAAEFFRDRLARPKQSIADGLVTPEVPKGV